MPLSTVPEASPEDLVPLRDVAVELHLDAAKLRRLAYRGEFPPLLRVTQKHYLVRRSDVEAWKAGRWTTAEAVRAAIVVEAVRGKVQNRRRKGSR